MMDLFFPTETFSKWTIIVTIVSWVIFYFFMRFTYWIRHGRVAYVPVKFPYIFGNISGEKHLALQLADVYENYKSEPIVAINILLEPVLVLTDLNLIKSVLTDSFDNFQDRGVFYNDKVDPLSAILGSLNYAKWKPLRGKLAQAFTSAKIKKMLENTIETFVNELENGLNDHLAFSNYIEIRDLFSRFATDVILTSTIGIQCNTLKTKSKLREIVKKAMQPNMKYPWNIVTLVYPRLARLIGIRKHSKEVGDFFMDIVEQTIQYRHGCRETRNDYMQLLIDLGLAKNQIAALAFDLWSAGYADSTSTIAYCLYELSLRKNKHIQDKVRDEIRTVLEQNNGHLTYAVLQMMGYLKNVINETLRKHPVAGSLTRMTTKPYRVANEFTIPEGMRVYIPLFGIHHDPDYYPNPEEFYPERFSRKDIPSGAFMPFGDGPRQCIGLRFAKLLISIGLVSLLNHFEFSTCEKTQIPIKYMAIKNTLIPSEGVWLKVNPI